MPISAVAINMWRHFLEIKNLTDENKTTEEIASAEKEFREQFLNNTYRTNEVVQEITIVDSTNTHIPLEKQIVMFPEAGEFQEIFCFFPLLTISIPGDCPTYKILPMNKTNMVEINKLILIKKLQQIFSCSVAHLYL